MNHVEVETVRAFTDGAALQGNKAGVCVLAAFPDDAAMQSIAAQMGHPETAFVVAQGAGRYAIRWFTPTVEVPLCGHATLAAAHVLRARRLTSSAAPVVFVTRDGAELTAEYDAEQIRLALPRRALTALPVTADVQACVSLPISAAYLGGGELLVELAPGAELNEVRVDTMALSKREELGVIVTSAGGEGYDYGYRYFAPNIGIPEDPVTGSVNGLLAPYWAQKLNKTQFVARQFSAEGGVLSVALQADHVMVAGLAVKDSVRHVVPLSMGEAA